MQADFHYCCIKCLAISAGFDSDRAQVVAYASQYVDDSTEHKGIDIDNVPRFAQGLIKDGKFEPICTAHKGIQYLSGLRKDVHRKVYIPFHFVPAETYPGNGLYDYRVRPDSPFANLLVKVATDSDRDAEGEIQELQRLIKLGISLHTYADTWSHHRFSGRWSGADNDIERIHLLSDGKWERIDLLDQIRYNAHPSVGHAEAMFFPDQSHLSWRYEHDKSGREISRFNTEDFLEAAEAIYKILCSVRRTRPNWKGFVGKIKSCLELQTDSVKSKFKTWRHNFQDISLEYDPEEWRADALDGDRYDWDHFQTAEDFSTLKYKAKDDPKWFLFHVEAKAQREMVNGEIRGDLL